MKWFRKWFRNWDLAMLAIGIALIYFSESIVTLMFPLDPMPVDVISVLIYMTIYTVAAFWLFKGIIYFTIKLYWDVIYQFFESDLAADFKELTKLQKVCIGVFFYLSLFFILALIFHASINAL